MEMHQLRYAVAVARTGNFSRAAEHCHVSQPSLSQQILKLEEEIGERLFERTKRDARPTSHGEAFLKRALRILAEADAVRRDAEDARQLLGGSLTIGVIPTIAPYLLPAAITEFTRRFPNVELIIHEETTARLLKLLHNHEVDLALLSRPFPERHLRVLPLFTEELLLALPPDHHLGRKRSIRPQDLGGERLIVLKEDHCLGDQVLGFCNREGNHPGVSFRSAQLETLQSLVRAGMGISLIPEMAARHPLPEKPLYRSFAGTKPRREVVAAWPEERPPGRGASEFLGLLGKIAPVGRRP
jgi:LysR family hydrogen peroxide-inducible transcriptional activator